MRPRRTYRAWYGVALTAGVLVVAIPVLVFERSIAGGDVAQRGYQRGRVWGAALGGGVALATAIFAVVNFYRASSERRIERSMAFWRRANEQPYLQHLDLFLRAWAATATVANPSAASRFEALGGSRQETLSQSHGDLRLAIEHLLDFYDEACCGVLTGACDSLAMYGYLGPLMVTQVKFLRGFIQSWRRTQGRPEKWDYLTHVTGDWAVRRRELEHGVKTVFRDPTRAHDRMLATVRDGLVGLYLHAVAVRKRDRLRRLLRVRRAIR